MQVASGQEFQESQGRDRRANVPAGEPPVPAAPQDGDETSQPWILVHTKAIDMDQDKIVRREEIVVDARKAFAGYDANQEDRLLQGEYGGRNGSARWEVSYAITPRNSTAIATVS